MASRMYASAAAGEYSIGMVSAAEMAKPAHRQPSCASVYEPSRLTQRERSRVVL
jgi:hypothetical protein